MLKKPDKNPTSLYKPQRIQSFCRQKIRNLCVHMHACTHVCIHITACVCLIKCVGSLCALSFSSCCRESVFVCLSQKKKKRHTITSSIRRSTKRESRWWTCQEKRHVFIVNSDIYSRRPSFVFVMEHVDEGNCHVIAPC